MVSHIAVHFFALTFPATIGGEVNGFNKTIATQCAKGFKAAQVFHGAVGVYRQGKVAAVGGDYHVSLLTALQGKGGNTVSLVAVAQRTVQGIECAFGNAPGLACKGPLFLGAQAEAAAFPKQTAAVKGQEKLGHQVLKHCARPACKTAVAFLLNLGAAQLPPVLYRHITLGNGNIACEHTLACHQVIPTACALLLAGVVTDIK